MVFKEMADQGTERVVNTLYRLQLFGETNQLTILVEMWGKIIGSII